MLFIGRHVGYPVALEGALKLKELAYIHAEGFAAGELKHGPIALIENQLPVFVVVPPRGRDLLHDKVVSNLQEVRARGAKTIVLAEEDDDEINRYADVMIRLPRVSTLLQPLVATVPLQIFACELATKKGHDVDQPRNLAKSVTVSRPEMSRLFSITLRASGIARRGTEPAGRSASLRKRSEPWTCSPSFSTISSPSSPPVRARRRRRGTRRSMREQRLNKAHDRRGRDRRLRRR